MSLASEIHACARTWAIGCGHNPKAGESCAKCDTALVQGVERLLDRRDLRATLLQQRESAYGAAITAMTAQYIDLMFRNPSAADGIMTAMKKLANGAGLDAHLKVVDEIIRMASQ